MDLSSTSLRLIAPPDGPDSYGATTPTLTRYMTWEPAPLIEHFEQVWRTRIPMLTAGTDVPPVVRLASSHEFLGMPGLHHIPAPEPGDSIGMWSIQKPRGT
jgi:hypothetical protein